MSKIENAIRNLTPEQRALLELRLKKKRQQNATVQQAIVQRSDTSSFPLTAGQRRLLSLEQLTPNTSRFNITEAYRIMGPLDVAALEEGIRETMNRHQVLRAAFLLENGTWVQRVLKTPDNPLFVKDLSHLAATQRLNAALTLVRKDLNTVFDLDAGHLIRNRIIRLAPNDHIFFITMHHLVCDAWSFELLLKEIATQYEAKMNKGSAEPPHLPVQYADFAAWQQGWLESEDATKQLAFWEETFASGIPPILLPIDYEQAAAQSTEGASKRIMLSQELVGMLMNVSVEQKLTPFTLFLSAFKCTLYRYSRQQKLAVCVPVAGRNRVETESLVGYFNNLLVISTQLNDEMYYKDVTDHISARSAEASDNQDIPFEKVAALPALRRVPLTRSFFTFQPSLSLALQLPGLEIEAIELENASADFDLAFYVEQKGEAVVIAVEYKSQLFKEKTIADLLANYVSILKYIADTPNLKLGDLPAFEMPHRPDFQAADLSPSDLPESNILEAALSASELSGVQREDYAFEEEEYEETKYEETEYEETEYEETGYEDDSETPATQSITLTVNGISPGGDMLPAKVSPRLHKTLPLVAPPDDIEQILTRIWERALGISHIGLHDNFFDLGGHSLMAVDIFNEIQKYIADSDLPLAALLESPTISALAERIRNGENEEWSPLIVIQPGRGSIPLFCVHGAGGNVLLYRDLAIQLGPDQTVYGLQSQGMDGMRPILGRIEDMAALYVKAIRKAYPEGPYLLLGYCMGGTLSFEIAQQLKAKGHEVSLLAMLETYNWAKAPKETFFSKIRYYLEKLEFHLRNYFLLSSAERKLFRSEKAAELQRRKKVWRGKLSVKLKPRTLVPIDGVGFNPRALAEVWRTNDEAVMVYEPTEYTGRVLSFVPMKEYSFHRHEELGWEHVVHDLETHVLSVFPAGMLIQPFVKELAQALRAEIYNITRDHRASHAGVKR